MNRFRTAQAVLVCLTCSLLLLLSACGSQSATTPKPGTAAPTKAGETKVLRIGASVGVTGIFATEGEETQQAYDVWMNHVNAQGGIKVGDSTYKVEIIYYDDKSDPQTAAKLVEKLITEDKVKILFGPYSSGITQAASAITDRYKVIMAASNACSDQLYTIGRKYLFTPMSACSFDFHNMVTLAKELDPSIKTAAVYTADNLAALFWAEGAKDFSEKNGLQVTAFQKYPLNTKDLSSMVTEIKSKNPDILFISDYIQNSILWVRQLKDLGVTPKILAFPSPTISQQFIDALGKDAEGVYAVGQFIPQADYKDPVFGSLKTYMELVVKAGQNQANDRHGAASGAGVMLQKALEKAGTVDDTEKIREALLALDLPETIFGPIKLNPNGLNGARKAGVLQVQKGHFEVVFPKDMAKQKPIYPLVPWNQR